MKFPRPSFPHAGGWVLTFALLCVAVTTGVIVYMRVWETQLLADPGWCHRVIAAAKTSEQIESAFGGCFSLLTKQVSALALNSHMDTGVLALCLLVLVVIVLAGGKLSAAVSKDSASVNIGGNDIPAAPQVITTTTTTVPNVAPAAPAGEPTLEDTP